MKSNTKAPGSAARLVGEETPGLPKLNNGLIIDSAAMAEMLEAANNLYEYVDTMNHLQQQAENISNRYGPGTRLYGFIEKTKDIAAANTQYAPPYFSHVELNQLVGQVEQLRNLKTTLDATAGIIQNILLLTTHESYQQALLYYKSVRELAKRNTGGAKAVYDQLSQYFDRAARAAKEPTRKQTERDVHSLLDGTKDGKIVIENRRPQATGGIHEVIDEKE